MRSVLYRTHFFCILTTARERCILLLWYETNGIGGHAQDGEREHDLLLSKEPFGAVAAIYDAAGVCKAEYAYDAWGNCTVISDMGGIGALNPIRYRGYFAINQIFLGGVNKNEKDIIWCAVFYFINM